MRERDLLDLVARIHESVFALDGWRTFVCALEESLSGSAVFLLVPTESDISVYEAATRNLVEWHAPSVAPDYVRSFLEHFRYCDPLGSPRTVSPGDTSIHQTSELMPLVDLGRSEYFNDWMRPQGLGVGPNLLGYLYAVGAPDMPALHVFRRPGRKAFTPADARALSALLLHIRQAVRTRFHLASVRAERNALLEVLDRLTLGVVLVDVRGRVVVANRSAAEVLAAADGLSAVAGELRAAKPGESGELRRLLAEAAETGAGKGLKAGGILSIERPSGKRKLVVLVTPLRSPGTAPTGKEPVAAVFISDAAFDAPAVEEVLRVTYGLTVREARLARELAEGPSLAEIAERAGTAVSTQRDRLKQVFAKTGATRQGELVRLVLAAAGQLRRQ